MIGSAGAVAGAAAAGAAGAGAAGGATCAITCAITGESALALPSDAARVSPEKASLVKARAETQSKRNISTPDSKWPDHAASPAGPQGCHGFAARPLYLQLDEEGKRRAGIGAARGIPARRIVDPGGLGSYLNADLFRPSSSGLFQPGLSRFAPKRRGRTTGQSGGTGPGGHI